MWTSLTESPHHPDIASASAQIGGCAVVYPAKWDTSRIVVRVPASRHLMGPGPQVQQIIRPARGGYLPPLSKVIVLSREWGGDGGLEGMAGLLATIDTTPRTTKRTIIPATPAKPPDPRRRAPCRPYAIRISVRWDVGCHEGVGTTGNLIRVEPSIPIIVKSELSPIPSPSVSVDSVEIKEGVIGIQNSVVVIIHVLHIGGIRSDQHPVWFAISVGVAAHLVIKGFHVIDVRDPITIIIVVDHERCRAIWYRELVGHSIHVPIQAGTISNGNASRASSTSSASSSLSIVAFSILVCVNWH